MGSELPLLSKVIYLACCANRESCTRCYADALGDTTMTAGKAAHSRLSPTTYRPG